MQNKQISPFSMNKHMHQYIQDHTEKLHYHPSSCKPSIRKIHVLNLGELLK